MNTMQAPTACPECGGHGIVTDATDLVQMPCPNCRCLRCGTHVPARGLCRPCSELELDEADRRRSWSRP